MKSFFVAPLLFCLLNCTAQAPTRAKANSSEKKIATPSRLTQLLPLRDRTVSTFLTQTDAGEQGRFMLEISRTSEYQAELSIAGRTDQLSIGLTGIEHAFGGYLLKEPLEKGATFRGQFGTVTITQLDMTLELPAGHFEHCLETIEESTLPAKRATSVFCPGVGLAQFIVESDAADDLSRLEAQLLKHEKRVDLVDSSADVP